MQLKWLAGGIQKALSACLFIAFRTDPICVCRQKCQWNQKGLLDEYRMGVGVAWSSHLLSAGLRNWLECQTDVFEWEAPAPWSQDSPARRILWPFHSKGEEGFSEYWDTYLYLNVGVFLSGTLSGEVQRAIISCLSPCISHPSSDCPSLWQQHMQSSYSAG